MTKRTDVDFSKHELHITKQEGLLVHHLKKPDTYWDSIKYINTNGLMAISGDYSNWLFCREFHPSADGHCSDGYWQEKLKNSSCQEPSKYDSDETELEIKEMLADPDREWSEEEKEYLEECLQYVDDEVEYTYHAYRNNPGTIDCESVPFCKKVDYHFLVILDGFEEICRRMKEEKEKVLNEIIDHSFKDIPNSDKTDFQKKMTCPSRAVALEAMERYNNKF